MTFADLAAHLAAHNVTLGLRLTVDAPSPGALTVEVKAALAEYKPLVVARVANAMQRAELESWTWGETQTGASGTPPF